MTSGRPPGLVRQALTRHWPWLLAVALLAGAPLSHVMQQQPERLWSSLEVYLVPSADEDGGLLVTSNTDRAARDYASVLRSDELLLTRLADAVHRSERHVRDHLEVGYLPRTGSIAVRYTAGDRREVQGVLDELDRLVSDTGLPSAQIGPGRVRPLGAAELTSSRNPLNPFPGAGVLAALALAGVAALLLERSRPRVLGRGNLRTLTDLPVLEVGTEADVELLAVRLLRAAPAGVSVLVTDGLAADAAARLLQRVSEALPGLVAERRVPADALTTPFALREPGAAVDGAWVAVTGARCGTGSLVAACAGVVDAAAGLVVLLAEDASGADALASAGAPA